MSPRYVHFDVYLNGVNAPGLGRAELVKRIESVLRLDRSDAAAFIASGARIRVRRGIDQDAAMKSILELQGLGAIVEIEPNRPPDEALAALEAIDLPDAPPAVDAQLGEVQALRDALKSLGGTPAHEAETRPELAVVAVARAQDSAAIETRVVAPAGLAPGPAPRAPAMPTPSTPRGPSIAPPPRAPSIAPPPRAPANLDAPTDPLALLQSLDGEAPALDVIAPSVPRPEDAHEPVTAEVMIGRESTAETDPAHDARFSAPSFDAAAMRIEMEEVAPSAREKPPSAVLLDEPFAAPTLCREHELPEPCSACAESNRAPPGRLMGGALRKNPGARIGIGIVLGLGLGYLASSPYASRAERRVAEVRAEANADRYKNAPEAQANTLTLDAKADALAKSAAFGTIAIWLLVGGGVFAGWFRLT